MIDGIFVDDVTVTSGGSTVLSDGAESGANGWTLNGWSDVGASVSKFHDNFYIAGQRAYTSYDQYLRAGPYYFGYANTKPDYVDHYAYQEGLLISYWDTSYADNDTFAHPGSGRNLYIDAHPAPISASDGVPWRSRVQVYDAPFGLDEDRLVHVAPEQPGMSIQGQAAQKVFDDTGTYWYAELPNHGVKLPKVGVKIQVLSVDGVKLKIRVTS